MRDLSERLALSYDATRPPALDVLVSAASPRGARARRHALTELARSRGQVFDELVERRRPAATSSSTETRLRDALQAARSRWANLAFVARAAPGCTRQCASGRPGGCRGRRAGLTEESAEFRRTRERKEASVDESGRRCPGHGAGVVRPLRPPHPAATACGRRPARRPAGAGAVLRGHRDFANASARARRSGRRRVARSSRRHLAGRSGARHHEGRRTPRQAERAYRRE